jgi:hypothetical protein
VWYGRSCSSQPRGFTSFVSWAHHLVIVRYNVGAVDGDHWSSPARNGVRLGGQCASAWTRDGPGVAVSSLGAESDMRGHLG